MKNLYDMYFYKGKYHTLEGLKRALIKDDVVWVSPKKNYYLIEKYHDYFQDREWWRDMSIEWKLTTEKDFNKWLKEMIDSGQCDVRNTCFYHSFASDCLGEMYFEEALEYILDDANSYNFDNEYDEYVETSEKSLDEYVDILTDEQFHKFDSLSDDKQMKIAMKWRINEYNKLKIKNNNC